VRDR
jgi:hypothetical protein